jgi:hypothetical protein
MRSSKGIGHGGDEEGRKQNGKSVNIQQEPANLHADSGNRELFFQYCGKKILTFLLNMD